MKYIFLSVLFFGCSTLSDIKGIDYSVNKDVVKKVLISSADDFRSCYQGFIQRAPDNEKKVSIVATVLVTNDGDVEKVDFDKKLENKLDNCLKFALYSLNFPKSSNRKDRTIEITQPFNLMPDQL